DLRGGLGVESWTVLGHSAGSDLAVRYAVEHPASVRAVIGVAGHGLHKDRTWSAAYHAGHEPRLDIEWDEDVWRALNESFVDWIHEPGLWRGLADCSVPMRIVAAGDDIRPDWPLRQLAATVPGATFESIPGVPHDFWHTHPETWRALVASAMTTE
ncbi:MAG TPA: alpha/beta hydrolase, partial [Nocardioides sp.]|nr:alpha/beta hydrolase [Nocardioides sp.]